MKPKLFTVVCLLTVIAIVLAGCGGGPPSPSSLTTTPTGAPPTTSTPIPSPVAETLEELLGRGANLTDVTCSQTLTIYNLTSNETKIWIKGLKARTDIISPTETIVHIYNAASKIEHTYYTLQKVGKKQPLSDILYNDTMSLSSPVKRSETILRQKPTIIGTETLNGKAVVKIEGTLDNGDKYNAWISKEYGIPLKVATVTGDNVVLEWKNVDTSPIPDTIFEIPADVKIILPDTTPPTIVSNSPATNASGILVNVPITATFSEEMKTTPETQTSFVLKSGDKTVNGKVSYQGNKATFVPDAELAYSTTYTATVTKQAKDAAGNSLLTDYSWSFKTRDAGILEGALNYIGEYPKPALVAYTDKSNKPVSVTAYPGQVQVYFDSKAAPAEVEALLKAKSATVIGKIPLIGYYLVQVAAGQEGSFINALRTDSRLKLAIPNIALSLDSDGVVVNSEYISKSIPVPLNVTGPVIIDAGDHGDELLQIARDNGGDIKHLVEVSDVSDGYFGADKVAMTVAAVAQGSQIFDPGKPVFINLSNSAGAQLNGEWVDYKVLDSPAKQQAAITSFKDSLLGKLQIVNSLPEELGSQKVLISQSAGNSNMDISQPLQEIRIEYPGLGLTMRDNVTIVTTDQSPSNLDRTRYPSGKVANTAPDDKDIVKINNAVAANGTSLAAVFSLALTLQAAREAGSLTPAQINLAFKIAALQDAIVNKELTLADSIAATRKVASIADSLKRAGKADDVQITKAMWLAWTINGYRDLVSEEVFVQFETISSLTATDPTAAMWATGITVNTNDGIFVTATIAPAIAGVTVQYIVTGKNPVTGKITTYTGSKKTDASGRISFNVPQGECEEWYTYKVTAVLSGKSATTRFMFYYD